MRIQLSLHVIGSIFSEKMTFGENGYRTTKENPVLALIVATGKGFRNEKPEKLEEIPTFPV